MVWMILSLLGSDPAAFLVLILAFVFALTVHEFSHAFAARLLGDRTAEDAGRLTLNPIAHLDLLGTLLLVTAGFGWGKPVPVNPYNLRSPRFGNALVAAAGPISNLLMVVVFGLGLRFALDTSALGPDNLLSVFLLALTQINLVLMVFNLIPIPPLDGSRVFFSFLPPSAAPFVESMQRRGPLLLLGVFIADGFLGLGIFSRLFGYFHGLAFRLLGFS
jgi:Zn-dependent protease